MHPGASHTRLIDVCRTRWIARIDGLDILFEIIGAVVRCLEAIKNNEGRSWNPSSIRDASGLFYGTI